jgi:hypothetical protein
MMITMTKKVMSLSLAAALLLSGCASAVSDGFLTAADVDTLCEISKRKDPSVQCSTPGSGAPITAEDLAAVVRICPVPNLKSFALEFEPITIELVAADDWESPQAISIPVPMLAEVEHAPGCDWPDIDTDDYDWPDIDFDDPDWADVDTDYSNLLQTPYPGMVVTISGENCKESSNDYYFWRLSGRGLSIEDRIDNESLYDVATVDCSDGTPQSFIMGPAGQSTAGGDLSWSTYPPTNTLDSSYLSLRKSPGGGDLRSLESSTWNITFEPLSALPSLELGKIYSPLKEEGWVGSHLERYPKSSSFFRYYHDGPEPLKVGFSKPDGGYASIYVRSDENSYFGIHRQFESLDVNSQTKTEEVFFLPGWNLIEVSSWGESERITFEPTE